MDTEELQRAYGGPVTDDDGKDDCVEEQPEDDADQSIPYYGD